MTRVTDNFFINAGVDADELYRIKGRSFLYIGTLFLAGMSLSFAALTIANFIG